jgi:hypothetical protein
MGLASPVSANKGIQIATANTILIAMDLGGIPNPVTSLNNLPSGIIDDYPNEYIEYSYNGQDTITRNVSCGGNQAILGGTAPDSNVSNAAVLPAPIPLFQYFDRNDQPTALIPNIRRIQITIVTDTAAKDTTQTGTPRPRRMIYSTSVIVRNHALSP